MMGSSSSLPPTSPITISSLSEMSDDIHNYSNNNNDYNNTSPFYNQNNDDGMFASSFYVDQNNEIDQDSPFVFRKRLDSVSSITRSRSYSSQLPDTPPLLSPVTEEMISTKPSDPSSFVSLLSITEKKSTLSKKLTMLKSWWSRCEDVSPIPLIPTDISSPTSGYHKRRCELKRSLSSQDLYSISKSIIRFHDQNGDSSTLLPSFHNSNQTLISSNNHNHNHISNDHYHDNSNNGEDCAEKFDCTPQLSETSSKASLSLNTSTFINIPMACCPSSPKTPSKSKDSVFTVKNTYLGQYRLLKTLGAGSFSTVKLAMDTTSDQLVAVKLIPKELLQDNEVMSNSVENEISILRQLSHPLVVKMLDSFDTKEDTCIVLEYVEGGELFSTIAYHFDTMNENRARNIFRQIVEVVKYIHDQKICHRDLKLENILLGVNDQIKLTDFGFAKAFLEGLPLTARCGSEEYTAPEIILGTPYDGRKVDVWALGVILFALTTGELPFNVEPGERAKAMYHRIARGEFKFPEDRKDHIGPVRKVSHEAKDLIRCMIKQNASKRYFLVDVLKHPWMSMK